MRARVGLVEPKLVEGRYWLTDLGRERQRSQAHDPNAISVKGATVMTSSDMQRSIIEAALTAATFDDAVAVAKMLQNMGAIPAARRRQIQQIQGSWLRVAHMSTRLSSRSQTSRTQSWSDWRLVSGVTSQRPLQNAR